MKRANIVKDFMKLIGQIAKVLPLEESLYYNIIYYFTLKKNENDYVRIWIQTKYELLFRIDRFRFELVYLQFNE